MILNAAQETCLYTEIGSATCVCSYIFHTDWGVFKTVVRHRQVQTRVQVPMQLTLKLISRPPARLVEFKSGTLICRTGNSAGPTACENTHSIYIASGAEVGPGSGFAGVCKRLYRIYRYVIAISCTIVFCYYHILSYSLGSFYKKYGCNLCIFIGRGYVFLLLSKYSYC